MQDPGLDPGAEKHNKKIKIKTGDIQIRSRV